MDDQSEQTEELKIEQDTREQRERELAERDPTKGGTEQHDRRAAKHAYLKERLAEREQAERESESQDG